MTEINETKAALSLSARQAWRQAGRRGTLAKATGIGKTKDAIDEIVDICLTMPLGKVLLIIPTEVLRDTDWPAEIQKWYPEQYHNILGMIRAECYASMHKITGEWDLVVFDEVHHFTIANTGPFFRNNRCDAILGLSATPPDRKKDLITWELVNRYCPVVFEYELDQGVRDKIVADYRINVVTLELDDIHKVLKAGSKKKGYFLQTEKKQYDFLTRVMKGAWADDTLTRGEQYAKHKVFMRRRQHAIYNLPGKKRLAEKMINYLCGPEKRTLVFCGSIDQCEQLCAPYTWHSKNKKKKPSKKNPNPQDMLDAFREGGIHTLGVVQAADEGVNIEALDQAIIVQADSTGRTMVQRIGRVVRYREGYIASVWIICYKGTQDEKWVTDALTAFDKTKITYMTEKEFDKQYIDLKDL